MHRNPNRGTLRSCLRRLLAAPPTAHAFNALYFIPVTLSASTFVEPTHSSQSPSRHLSFRLRERHRSYSPLARPVASLHHSLPLLRETVVCLSHPAPLRRQSPEADQCLSIHLIEGRTERRTACHLYKQLRRNFHRLCYCH